MAVVLEVLKEVVVAGEEPAAIGLLAFERCREIISADNQCRARRLAADGGHSRFSFVWIERV